MDKLHVAVKSLEFICGGEKGLGELLVQTLGPDGETQTFRESLNEIYCGSDVNHRPPRYNDERGRLGVAMKTMGERLSLHYEHDVFAPNPQAVRKG